MRARRRSCCRRPSKPTAGANATPSNTDADGSPPPLHRASRSASTAQATTYHVYDVTSASARTESGELRRDLAGAASGREGGPPIEPDPYDIKVPTPITPAPVADTELVIKGVTFGVERCFEVRPVDQVFGATVIGPASPRTCVTPKDTSRRRRRRSLAAIAGAGVINLIWDANTESDLAGYIVLRGEAPGDTLQPITQGAGDRDVVSRRERPAGHALCLCRGRGRSGDAANMSPQSNRAEETARQ